MGLINILVKIFSPTIPLEIEFTLTVSSDRPKKSELFSSKSVRILNRAWNELKQIWISNNLRF